MSCQGKAESNWYADSVLRLRTEDKASFLLAGHQIVDRPVSIDLQPDGFGDSVETERTCDRCSLGSRSAAFVFLGATVLVFTLSSAVFASSSSERLTQAPSSMVPSESPHSGAGESCPGLKLLAVSRTRQGISSSTSAVNENTDTPERLLALLADELRLHHIERARACVIKAKELFPADPGLAYQMGGALLAHNLLDDAEAEFHRAAALLTAGKSAPSNLSASDIHLQLARLHYDRHDYWAALDALTKVSIADIPAQLRPSAWHLAGQSLVGVGNAPEALENLRQATQLNSANPEYPVHLAWAQLLAGDTKAADVTAQHAAKSWPNVPDVQLIQTLVKRENAAMREKVPLSQEWHLKGEGIVCCPCRTPCPCRSNSMPTHMHCENTGLVRIHQGHYGQVSLDGFTFAAVNNEMEAQSTPAIIYVEPSATDEQLIALERIMQSFNPVQPAIITDVEKVPISFINTGANGVYEIRIPKILEMKIRRRLDGRGRPLFATAALDQFANTIEYAQNLTYKLWNDDGTLKWDYSGRQANYRSIDLDSQAYTKQAMLIQFADLAGAFNSKQMELIKSQKLPFPTKPLRNPPAGRQPSE